MQLPVMPVMRMISGMEQDYTSKARCMHVDKWTCPRIALPQRYAGDRCLVTEQPARATFYLLPLHQQPRSPGAGGSTPWTQTSTHTLHQRHPTCTNATQHAPHLGWHSSPRHPHRRIPWTHHLGRHPHQKRNRHSHSHVGKRLMPTGGLRYKPQQNRPKALRMP